MVRRGGEREGGREGERAREVESESERARVVFVWGEWISVVPA
jgi:hypothetical protein